VNTNAAETENKIKKVEGNTVRWGLIGVGDIVRKRVAEALSTAPDSALIAVAAAHPGRAEAFAREWQLPVWHADWRDLVRDPRVNAIYVASPVVCHAAQVLAAARALKPVLCEKPLAMDAAGSKTMVDACCRAGVVLGTAYYRRYFPVVRRIRELLASGEIGAPVIVQMNALSHFDPGADHPRRWLVEKKTAGGGPLKDFGCHRIELLLHLFGPVEQVSGTALNLRWMRDVEDTAVVNLSFKQRTQGTITVSHAAAEPRDTLDIYGTEGSLHVPELNRGKLILVSGQGSREEEHPPLANLHLPLIAGFVQSILQGEAPDVTGETGLAVDEIMDEIYAEQGNEGNRG
jgi:predicted dehydrogenase